MSTTVNQQVWLKSLPTGIPQAENSALHYGEVLANIGG